MCSCRTHRASESRHHAVNALFPLPAPSYGTSVGRAALLRNKLSIKVLLRRKLVRRRCRLRRSHEKLQCKKRNSSHSRDSVWGLGVGEWGIERKAVEVALPFRPALRKSKKCFPTTYSTAREVETYCVFRVIKEEFFLFFFSLPALAK